MAVYNVSVGEAPTSDVESCSVNPRSASGCAGREGGRVHGESVGKVQHGNLISCLPCSEPMTGVRVMVEPSAQLVGVASLDWKAEMYLRYVQCLHKHTNTFYFSCSDHLQVCVCVWFNCCRIMDYCSVDYSTGQNGDWPSLNEANNHIPF